MKLLMAASDKYKSVEAFCANADQAELEEGIENTRKSKIIFAAAGLGTVALAGLSAKAGSEFGVAANTVLTLLAGLGSRGFHNTQRAIEAEQAQRQTQE